MSTSDQQSSNLDVMDALTVRFFRYLIDIKYAISAEEFDDGILIDEEIVEEHKDTSQESFQRVLLDVEKQRAEKVEMQKAAEKAAVAKLARWFSPRLLKHIQFHVKDIEYVERTLLRFPSQMVELIDMLYSPSMTYKKVAALVRANPALESTLLEMVNRKSFQKQIGRSVSQKIRDSQVAVSMLSFNGAKAILPIIMFKHMVKFRTEHFPLMGHKLWKHMVTTGVTAHYLLQQREYKDPVEGLLIGMYMHLGKLALFHQFIYSFDEVKLKALEKFHAERQKSHHDNLMQVGPDQAVLLNLYNEFAHPITQKLFDMQNWQKPNTFKLVMEELSENKPISECHPVTVAVRQGEAFSKFHFLKKMKLFPKQALGPFLDDVGLNEAGVKLMMTLSLTRLNLSRVIED